MKRNGNRWLGVTLAGGVLALSPATVAAQALQAAEASFLKGDYPACLRACAENIPLQVDFTAFAALEVRTLLETGKYKEALTRGTVVWRQAQFDPELSLRLGEALRANGQVSQARSVNRQALQFQPEQPVAGRSRSPVAYGELALAEKVDAKEVLQRVFEPSKKADPAGRAAYLAIGRLALAHHDRELAAENFREGLKRFAGDPEFLFGLEQAGVALPKELQQPEEGISSYLDLALRANPGFTEALLYKAEKLGGGNDFKGAKQALDRVLAVNPDHPEAWAELAALALLADDATGAEKALKSARKFWKENPRVSEIIGTTLAAHYRFAEAIVHLKQASEEEPDSPSIHFELGSNQLRFGQLDDGWKNVALAHELDPYHVAAFNLITLRDKLQGFPVREKDGVRLRMSPEDMAVFGSRALDLAARAKRTFTEKYQVKLAQPVMVEMLPKQEDFAIRTFGLPGGESFLGVCFGPLITTTSPRGRLGRANWETVVWHEMAHAITLSASRHRIPRWLSEGISVYEERQVRPGWGQGMTSAFRERFLSGKVPPIARLDESFAGPDIMLGYYHASLVAEFVVERFGIAAMRSILADLGAGKPIEKALSARTLPLPELETAFLEHAKKIAAGYGPDLEWSQLTDEEYVAYRENPAVWVAAHPKRYAASMTLVSKLIGEGKWNDAKALLVTVIAAEPNNREEFNPYHALALACRGLGDEAGERTALKKLLEIDSNLSESAARLLQIDSKLPAPERLADGQRMLETNPFQEQAYRTLIAAAKETGAPARDWYLSLLALETLDAGRLRFELATLIRNSDRDEARRQVLKALEDNPRFEAALEFLVQLPKSP